MYQNIKDYIRVSVTFKTILGVILFGCITFQNIAQTYRDQDGNGLIEIRTINQLDSMRYNLTGTCSPAVCNGYELKRNLDFNDRLSYRDTTGKLSAFTKGSGWDPIGKNDVSYFNAIFEGNRFTIAHLYIKRPSTTNIGFFGSTWYNSHIRNIGVTKVSVSGSGSYYAGSYYVGGLMGWNYGTITNSYATGSVLGSNSVGGLVGHNTGTIIQSYDTVNVKGDSTWGTHSVGGLVGWNNYGGTIRQSYATGTVTAISSDVGGLVGSNYGNIIQNYATGNVTGSYFNVGGLVGYNYQGGTITQSYATGNVKGGSDAVGGLVGWNDATITHCYWNKDASQTVGKRSPRSNSTKQGVFLFPQEPEGPFVRGLTLSALKSASDSIRELGQGFIYRQGRLPKINSITFSALRTKIYGDAPFVLEATSSMGLTVSFSASNTLVGISNNTLTIKGAGTVSITAFQTGKADSVVQILTINTLYQSISFETLLRKTFGDAPFVLEATSSEGFTVSFSASNTLVSVDNNNITINGAGAVSITAYSENDNYFPTSATQRLKIYKANQSISFEPLANKTFGDAPFVLSASSSAGHTVFFSASNALVSISNNTVTINGVGVVSITAFQTGNGNYLPAYATQILTITEQPNSVNKTTPTLTFSAIPNLTIGQKYVLIASSNSPVAVTFTSSDNDKLSIVGNTATAKASGTVTITANQVGNTEYNSATSAQNVTVTDPNLQVSLIKFTAIPSLTVGQKYTLVASSNSPVAITFASSNLQVATVSGNTLTAVGTGTSVITANQAGNAQFNVASAKQTVTVINKTGTTTPALTFVETPNNSIRIFPNPANDYITIQYDKTQKVSSVKVYDMTGKNYELKMNNYELGMKADVKHLPKGEYILVIYGEKGEVLKTEKVIKE